MAHKNVIDLNNVKNEAIQVTQPYVPSIDKYMFYVSKAFDNKWLTNGGPLVGELTERLKSYLGVENLLLVNNGTSALQLAYRIKGLNHKNVVTTPYTFPATLTALSWSEVNINLCDIRNDTWNLSAESVKTHMVNNNVDAVVPVNIFGAPCELEEFDQIGKEFGIPIIYDSAQAMLSKYQGQSIFNYGDIHCVSFHATKLFHTVEGGALIFKDKVDLERAENLINFGIGEFGKVHDPGINAKMSELHAAMGLCVLDDLPYLIENRQKSVELYKKLLSNTVEFQKVESNDFIPPMYMPVKFETEQQLLTVMHNLSKVGYMARRYFYPGNNKFIDNKSQNTLWNNINTTDKILCLPLMHNLSKQHVTAICNIVKQTLNNL